MSRGVFTDRWQSERCHGVPPVVDVVSVTELQTHGLIGSDYRLLIIELMRLIVKD